MTKIQAKSQDFKILFEKIKLQGKDETKCSKPLIYNCILNCKDNKVTTSLLNSSCTVFGEFEFKTIKVLEEGNISIGNIQEFSEYINKFAGENEITIETTENEILIKRDSPKKVAKLNLTSETYIEDSNRAIEILSKLIIEEEKVIFNEVILDKKFIVDCKNIKEALDDGNISSITRVFKFDFTENKINCLIGENTENRIETEIPISSGNGNCKNIFRQGIDNVFSNISGEVKIYISEDSPMFVSSEDNFCKSKFVIAPAIE